MSDQHNADFSVRLLMPTVKFPVMARLPSHSRQRAGQHQQLERGCGVASPTSPAVPAATPAVVCRDSGTWQSREFDNHHTAQASQRQCLESTSARSNLRRRTSPLSQRPTNLAQTYPNVSCDCALLQTYRECTAFLILPVAIETQIVLCIGTPPVCFVFFLPFSAADDQTDN